MVGALLAVGAGAVLLIVASDRLVEGAAGLAVRLRVSAVVTGVVIMGFGTSAPELLVSTLAAARGSRGIGVGNLVGSNLANLSLVLGLLGLVSAPVVSPGVLRRRLPVMALGMAAFALVLHSLGRWEGAVLVGLFVGAMAWLMSGRHNPEEVVTPGRRKESGPGGRSPALLTALTVGGLVGTLAGAQLLVTGARDIAESLGWAEGLVGFTVTAVGTTLPEIAGALQAGRKSQTDLALGNVFGSNLFNSLASGGAVALVSPGAVDAGLLAAAWVSVAVAAGAGLMMWTGGRLGRWEGAVLLVVYAAAIPLVA
jgi:cation:H+ antiporter